MAKIIWQQETDSLYLGYLEASNLHVAKIVGVGDIWKLHMKHLSHYPMRFGSLDRCQQVAEEAISGQR
jgi:hypothetical protein